ncbi:serine/threonine-protein kinase [uncultured Friedmanniella sp.]|uniref:serine/threonine-protein kinase n=1 Tax=uncultured Friedmanniella sp. TaxID=335381 RepID=UPI0035CB51FB
MAITPPQIPGLTDWRPLARGGFATVWEARQETLDRLVAVKVDQRRLDVEAERRRFLREAGAAGRMSAHPGIITVHDAGILSDDRPYLVMDLCPGGSLTRYLAADARLTPTRVRDIGVRIADALAATHARGVLHRDVKPANILIDSYGNVGLADFGLAAIAGPETPPKEAFEVLTPAYTAPEILHRRPPSATGDVYSLAATLYALLSGRPPRWPAEGTPTLVEVLERQQQPVEPLSTIDPAFMQLLLEALALEPAGRPDAAEFGRRLAALPLGETAEDRDDALVPAEAAAAEAGPRKAAVAIGSAAGGRSRRVSDPRRRGLVAALLALVLVAVLVGTLVVINRGRQSVVADPVPASTAASTASSSPTPPSDVAAVPLGFSDCSTALGQPSYCSAERECWTSVISVFDTPRLGNLVDCDKNHVYQTFVAGPLDFDVRTQSSLEADAEVKQLCSSSVLKRMLDKEARKTDWEILSLPPQPNDGDARFFRCIFGRGERLSPVDLQQPG